MLKKRNRLKSNSAFSATYKNNVIINSDCIILYVGKQKDNEDYPTRVGFVVSKKVHKRAVKRNRIKRLMRENIRLILKNNTSDTINNFQSLIFIAKNSALNKNSKEIYYVILTLLQKLAIKNI